MIAGNNGFLNIVRMLIEHSARHPRRYTKGYRRRNNTSTRRMVETIIETNTRHNPRFNPNIVIPEGDDDHNADDDEDEDVYALNPNYNPHDPNSFDPRKYMHLPWVDQPNHDGLTPVLSAMLYGQLFVVEYLIAQAADMTVYTGYVPPGADKFGALSGMAGQGKKGRSGSVAGDGVSSRGSSSAGQFTNVYTSQHMSHMSHRSSGGGAGALSYAPSSMRSHDMSDDDDDDDGYDGVSALSHTTRRTSHMMTSRSKADKSSFTHTHLDTSFSHR